MMNTEQELLEWMQKVEGELDKAIAFSKDNTYTGNYPRAFAGLKEDFEIVRRHIEAEIQARKPENAA